MSIFFFVVGLELKREVLVGEISTKRKAFLPIAAALGGMVVPALIYAAFNWGTPAIRGWGIPMATDIAFALGVLSLVGRKASASSKVFLTALATIDDLGAILVIAVFYVYNLSVINLGFALIAFVILVILNQIKVKNLGLYLVCGVFLWFAILKSGVHPTIAGVLLALVIPRNAQYLERLEQRLNPWVNFAILPVFALANAGVQLGRGNEQVSWTHPITLGVFFGLMFGKQIGITLFSWLSVRLGLSALPSQMTWRQLYGIGWLGGIGFTMSLFIATLAFDSPALLAQAKLGILTATLVSGVVGYGLMKKSYKS